MQFEWGTISRTWGRPAAWTSLTVVVFAMLFAAGCHQWGQEVDQPPVAVGIPPEVSQKVDNAQAAYVDALRTIATDYDAAVCEEEGQMAERSQERQAMAEARLEVAEAVGSARSQVQQNQGGGPTVEDEGITLIEEAPEPKRDRGGWTCLDASGQPACVSAASSYVARQVWRNYGEGHDLNPVTAGDVLEAFAADARWADQYLVAASDKAEAYEQIRQGCKDGKSPLAQFFRAAAKFDHPEVRTDLLELRNDFVGGQQNVCEALPFYYENTITEMRNNLSLRIRNDRCATSQWEPLWE